MKDFSPLRKDPVRKESLKKELAKNMAKEPVAKEPAIKELGPLIAIKKELAGFLKKEFLPLEEEEQLVSLLERPRHISHGQLSLPLFSLFKERKQGPQSNTFSSAPEWAKALACDISAHLPSFLKSCEALSAFVNFRFKATYLQRHLSHFASQKKLGHYPDQGSGQHWVLDFASPNVAKHINIGHLRAASLGQALVHISRAFGFKLTAINHLGDWGGQFGKLLWAYKKWGSDFKRQPFDSMVELYVRFYKEAEGDEKNRAEARQLFLQLEKQGSKDLKALWERFVRLSLTEYDKYWKAFNIQHDLTQGESFYVSLLPDLKKRLVEKNLLEKSEGAEVVFLEKNSSNGPSPDLPSNPSPTSLPPCLIVKSDGASTYQARDLASLIYRFEKLKADKNIYIAGIDQALHFQQVFQVAEKLNPKWEASSLHLSFGMYRFKGEGERSIRKMSSRRGQAVYLKDILQQAQERVKKIIEERNPDLRDKEKVCLQVAAGALIFNDLMNDRLKDVDFDWDRVLDFEGRSGPFVQYSLVRAKSLLAKLANSKSAVSNSPSSDIKFSNDFETESELSLMWLILCFEAALFHSLKNFKPHILARYLLDLASAFNRFYAKEKVLGHRREADRSLLVRITGRVLSRGMDLLNIPKPEAM